MKQESRPIRFPLLLTALVLLIAACGDGMATSTSARFDGLSEPEPTVAEVNTASADTLVGEPCSVAGTEIDASKLDTWYLGPEAIDRQPIVGWLKVDTDSVGISSADGFVPDFGGSDQWREVVLDGSGELLDGRMIDHVFLPVVMAEQIAAVSDSGDSATLFVGLSESGSKVVLLAAGDGSAAFLGNCEAPQTQYLREVVATQDVLPNASVADFFERYAAGDADVGAAYRPGREAPDQPAWADLDPWDRVLDPESTPEDVLESHLMILLRIQLPEGVQVDTHRICTKATTGWNGCAILSLGTVIELDAYAPPGTDLDVYVADFGEYTGDFAPVLVTTVSSADILEGAEKDEPVDVTIQSLELP